MKQDDKVRALLEDYNSKMDAILEYVKDIPSMKQKIDNIETTVASVEDKMVALEHVLQEHSTEIATLKTKVA